MLVLTRKSQEQIQIGDNITITVVRIKGRSVRIGIDAPDEMRIVRGELAELVAEFDDIDDPATGYANNHGQRSRSGSYPRESSESNDTPTSGGDSNCHLDVPSNRIPGASRAPLSRNPQRLGPVFSSCGSYSRLPSSLTRQV